MENMDLFKEQLKLTETCEYKIFNERYLKEISVGSSSKGNQEKWYDTNNKYFIKAAFYYENKYWQDYLVEIIVSKLARQMNLGQIRVVNQHRCLIKKKDNIVNGVFSKDFRDKESQIFIPFNRLLKLHADEGIRFILFCRNLSQLPDFNFLLSWQKSTLGGLVMSWGYW